MGQSDRKMRRVLTKTTLKKVARKIQNKSMTKCIVMVIII